MTWQPIETAPKDGRFLRLKVPGGNVVTGRWEVCGFVSVWDGERLDADVWRPFPDEAVYSAPPEQATVDLSS